MHRNSSDLFGQDIATFDPALALQLDQALHVEDDAAQFLPPRGKAGEVVAGIFVRQPARVQRTVGVPGQVDSKEPLWRTQRLLRQDQEQQCDDRQEHQSANS